MGRITFCQENPCIIISVLRIPIVHNNDVQYAMKRSKLLRE